MGLGEVLRVALVEEPEFDVVPRFGVGDEAGIALHRDHVGLAEHDPGVQPPGFELSDHRAAVGDQLERDPIEVRAGHEVRVALDRDVVPGDELDELKRTAHHAGRSRPVPELLARDGMFRHPGGIVIRERFVDKRREHLFELDRRLEVSLGGNRRDVAPALIEDRAGLLIGDQLPRVDEVFDGYRLAVGPFDPLLQLDFDRFSVGRNAPVLRGRYRLQERRHQIPGVIDLQGWFKQRLHYGSAGVARIPDDPAEEVGLLPDGGNDRSSRLWSGQRRRDDPRKDEHSGRDENLGTTEERTPRHTYPSSLHLDLRLLIPRLCRSVRTSPNAFDEGAGFRGVAHQRIQAHGPPGGREGTLGDGIDQE